MFYVLALFLACSTTQPAEEPHGHDHDHGHTHDEPAAEPAPAPAAEAAKWEMDDHTRKVMEETQTTVDAAKIATVEDAIALGNTLQGQLDRLIKGCTMEGPAHDELHVFLMHWIPEVDGLQKATSVADSQSRLTKLVSMLDQYKTRFE